MNKLWRSGLVFSAASFLTGLGNLAFQGVLGRHLKESGDYGNANSALGGFIPLLGLLPAAATFAVTHYIAHFNACGESASLQGLLAGCRKFLFQLTVGGSVLAVLAVKPLSDFFHYSTALMLITLISTLLGLWVALITALCQGLSWFKRLALIGFVGMMLRVSFGWFVTLKWPSPETAVLASTFAMLAYLVLFFWKKDLSLHGEPVSPWSREFIRYLVISTAFVVGNFCFCQGDYLVAKKNFSKEEFDAYTAAGILARALPMTVSPLLLVLFASRSGQRTGNMMGEQLKLLALSSLALVFGAICLFVLRTFCLKLLNKYTPEATALVGHFATTMVFVGLIQSLAYWSLASRWTKISLLYGGLGIAYWLMLFCLKKSPTAFLQAMPVAAGITFAALFIAWLMAMRASHPKKSAQS